MSRIWNWLQAPWDLGEKGRLWLSALVIGAIAGGMGIGVKIADNSIQLFVPGSDDWPRAEYTGKGVSPGFDPVFESVPGTPGNYPEE